MKAENILIALGDVKDEYLADAEKAGVRILYLCCHAEPDRLEFTGIRAGEATGEAEGFMI